MMLSITLSDLKSHLDDLLIKIKHDHRRCTVIKKHDPVAVLIPTEDLRLLERFERAAYIEKAKKGIDVLREQGRAKFAEIAKNVPYELLIPVHLESLIKKMTHKKKAVFFTCINSLAVNPHPAKAKKISGMLGLHRLNMGDYLILYRVEEKSPVIDILALFDREDL
jgi:PHD/YefM family antitoxin component YafN of YafNO toxin-antitoxin module